MCSTLSVPLLCVPVVCFFFLPMTDSVSSVSSWCDYPREDLGVRLLRGLKDVCKAILCHVLLLPVIIYDYYGLSSPPSSGMARWIYSYPIKLHTEEL